VAQRRLRLFGIGVAFGLLSALGLLGWGVLNARAAPEVRSAVIGLPYWPAGTAPIKVVLMSDIHMGNVVMGPRRLNQIVSQINALRPDLVVLAGDFVVGHNPSGVEARAVKFTGPLAGLRPRLGAVAVLGNHDYWTQPRVVQTALSRAGISVLDNQAVRAGPIVIAGVGDGFSGHDAAGPTLEEARRYSGPIVVLTHSPDLSPSLPADVHLVLAGHTHCGQVMLPWGEPLALRSPYAGGRRLYDPRYRCGLIHDPGRSVIVTSGVGSGTAPIRFGAPPDIWILTLGPERTSPAREAKAP
jgi:predicted MPP superfamily phosphohydrolase